MGRSRKIRARDIARAAGVSDSAVSQSRHVKRKSDGSVDVQQTEQGLRDLEAVQLRKARSLADLAELKLAKRAAGLTSAADAQAAWTWFRKITLERMSRVSVEAAPLLAPESDPRKVQTILDTMLRAALQELTDTISHGDPSI